MDRIIAAILNRPWTILVSLTLLVAAALRAGAHLELDFTPQQLFEADDPDTAFLRELSETFGKEDNSILVLVHADDVFAPEVLEYVSALSDGLDALDDIDRVDSITHSALPAAGGTGREQEISLDRLADDDGPFDAGDAALARRRVSSSPLLTGLLVSDDGRYTVVSAQMRPHLWKVKDLAGVVGAVEEAMERVPPPEGVDADLTGLPPVRVEVVEKLLDNQERVLPITFLIFAVVLFAIFRRLSWVAFQLGAVSVALCWGLGLMGATGESMNIINHVITTVVFVIVISDSVHLFVRYEHERIQGWSRTEALKRMLSALLLACFLTSLTSAVGFFSLAAARTDILKRFGVYLGLTILMAYPATILLSSTLLKLFPAGSVKRRPSMAGLDRGLAAVGGAISRRPRTVLAAALAVGVVFVAFAPRVRIDNYALSVFTPEHRLWQVNKVMEEHLIGLIPLSILVESDRRGRMKDPEVLHRIARVQERLDGVAGIRKSVSLADYVKEANLLFGRRARTIPDDPGAVAELLLLYEFQEDDALYKVVDETGEDYTRTRIRTWLPDGGAAATIEGERVIRRILEEELGDLDDVRVRLTGEGHVAAMNLDLVVRDLFTSLLLASVVIFVFIGLLFRSIRYGLITIIPNMLPLLVTVGYMGMRGYDLEVSTVVIFSISLGIAVDSTIHFLARFLEETKQGVGCDEAITATFRSSGKAIVLSTLLFLCGFLVLLISDFMPARLFAELTGLTLFAALLGDLFILPALLKLLHRVPAAGSATT